MGLTRPVSQREFEIRSHNRYTLHAQNKKQCTKCEVIYEGINEHFDVHRIKDDGTYQYTGPCKNCSQAIRATRTSERKSCIEKYAGRLLVAVKHRAGEIGVPFDLCVEDLIQLWYNQKGTCFYTKEQMDLQAVTPKGKSPHRNFPSLDRMHPERGYTKDNVVWCLYYVNRMKNDLPIDEFMDFCKVISQNEQLL